METNNLTTADKIERLADSATDRLYSGTHSRYQIKEILLKLSQDVVGVLRRDLHDLNKSTPTL